MVEVFSRHHEGFRANEFVSLAEVAEEVARGHLACSRGLA